ncbi:esterase B1-like [Culicoides brevitarsis]|uniref:esterase B1-like n=1 Tax=Culicoides brevitarsis TaxID=469753 RepID=UPI00307C1495
MSTVYPIVNTNSGPVKGISRKNDVGKVFYSFQHIPYAQQPIGELRFKDPRPVIPWNQPLDCTKEGPKCFQFDNLSGELEFFGSDECLGVNIFTPNLKPWRPLPVCVWIHGGGFVVGSSSTDIYGPDLIVEKGVIMVSFNYRLGIFGFLSLKDPKLGVPGNAGLKDQSMALKWIKENISHFGGDPNNITVFGGSAGGASVHYQMISPMSKNLFNRAVPMSGSALSPWATVPTIYPELLKRLAAVLRLPEDANDEILYEALLKCDPKELLIYVETLIKPEEKLNSAAAWSSFLPQVEPYVSEMCFLPASPLELGRNAWSLGMDVIFGGCENEGFLWNGFSVDEAGMMEINKNNAYLLPKELFEELGVEEGNSKGKILKEFYFGEKDVSRENFDIYLSYLDEATFWHQMYRAFVLQRQNSSGNTFLYNLNIPPSVDVPGFYKLFRDSYQLTHMNGTCHGEDLPLLFKTKYDRRFQKGDDNYAAQQVFLNFFIEFVKRGDPNFESLETTNDEPWKPLEKGQAENLSTLEILRNEIRVQQLTKGEKIKVWNGLYDDNKELLM